MPAEHRATSANRRVVLAGNNTAACHVLDVLVEALPSSEILAISPPAEAVRAWQDSLAAHSAGLGVTCLEPEDVNSSEVVRAVEAFGADLLLSVYYTQLFGETLLSAVEGPALNFHPALLPRHRGTAPLIWAVADGDATTGVSVHHIDRGVDTGSLVWQRPLPIDPHETGYELHVKVAALVRTAAAELVSGWLVEGALPKAWEQRGQVSVHSSRDPSLNELDFRQPRRRVRDVVRALAPPLPGAFCSMPRERGRLVLSRLEPFASSEARGRAPGTLELSSAGTPAIWCVDGPLRVEEFIHHGQRRHGAEMPALLGLEEGDVLNSGRCA